MKKLYLLVCLAFTLVSFDDGVTNFTKALEKADSQIISSYFAPYIGIKLQGEVDFKKFDKKQATSWINTFYTEKNITGFQQNNIVSNEGYTYIYGKLLSSSRKYNVTFVLKGADEKYTVTSLKFN